MNLITKVSPFHPTMSDINALGGYRAAQTKNIAYTLTSDVIPEIEAIIKHEDTESY